MRPRRLGVVDHVSCHPLGSATPMEEAVRVARGVGDAVAALGVPVYYYGHASRCVIGPCKCLVCTHAGA